MKKLIVSLLALAFSAGALVDAAQAARLGGGRSLGVQRQVTAPPRQATPPTQQQQPAAAQPAGSSRWLAPLAGLAAGLGLGWLFAQGGFGAAMSALLMALLVGAAVFALARLGSGRSPRSRSMQYAGLGSAMPSEASLSEHSPSAGTRTIHRSNVPADFDAERFLAEAKRNFLRLQEANDRGDLDLIREVTTEEMFRALEGGKAGGGQAQQTDVVTLNAVLLDLVAENGLYWASVRLSGSIREKAQAAAEPFEEVWHLQKPADGSSGWLLAGIQQLN
jgi:predicted lipid-binding transport protein (Tim44 family)